MSDLPRRLGILGLLVVALALPLVLEDFWLQLGLFVMATMVGAVGLTLLVGVAGQLSLGHAAFAAIGAYVYVWATSESTDTLAGAGLPAVVGLVLGVAGAAFVGFVFSPVASRLRGIYLGLATLGLVFIVRHLLLNLDAWTGGFNGRSVEPFTIGGFSFSNKSPDYLAVAGVQFQGLHRLWYLFLVLTLLASWLAANLRTSRTGRAWANVRDSETAAAAMGIAVARYKASAFVVSSGAPETASAPPLPRSLRKAPARPPRRNSSTAMIASPYSSRDAVAGSRPPEPAAARKGSELLYCVSTSGSAVTKSAPTMAPPTEPRPPSTIITRKSTDTVRVKTSGESRP